MPTTIPIDEAYATCRTITFTHAKTFAFASHFIPASKRNACYAVYAFCRYVDDLVDVAMERGNVTRDDAVRLVAQWHHDLDTVYAGGGAATETDPTRSAILLAWEDTLSRYHIPRNLPDELIEGVLMDVSINRFATFDALTEYCYKVASVVGLMTSEIFGYASPDALPRAVDLGIAMQLTNIIRDVKEDADRGRIYLAGEDLAAYGVSEEDVLAHRWTPAMRELIREYVRRADAFYASAEPGIAMLDPDSRLTVMLMHRNYRRILRVVEGMDHNVFRGRARTSLVTKLLAVPTAWLAARRLPPHS
jgi:phytoene synthase